MISLIITILIDYEKNKPVMGTGFLMGIDIFTGTSLGWQNPAGLYPLPSLIITLPRADSGRREQDRRPIWLAAPDRQ
jgi:hypothetical protein